MEPVTSTTIPLSAPGAATDGADLLARLFAGVSDPTRLRILLALLERERNVSELVTPRLDPSAMSALVWLCDK